MVDPETYEVINKMACDSERSIVGQLRWIISKFVQEKTYQVTKIEPLPAPPDATPVPLVTITEA
jgi:hypothetical protein